MALHACDREQVADPQTNSDDARLERRADSKDHRDLRCQLPPCAKLWGHDIVEAADLQFDRQLTAHLDDPTNTPPTGTVHLVPRVSQLAVMIGSEKTNQPLPKL